VYHMPGESPPAGTYSSIVFIAFLRLRRMRLKAHARIATWSFLVAGKSSSVKLQVLRASAARIIWESGQMTTEVQHEVENDAQRDKDTN
jgi:hypothetical protein